MREGDHYVTRHDLSSLRLLGSVGEPINPEAWRWYHDTVGKGRIPVVDTWWQTETGGIMITTLPGAHAMQRSEEHTSELQSLMRTPYADFCLKKKKQTTITNI